MANDGETRRLAAIMASDVVGFTSLMGTDEAGTLAALKTLRKDLWDPKISEHGGRVVKLTGDGQLTEFPSVADAVQCAVEVQRAMARRNADIPESHRIVLRVGINLGDVIIDGDDIYGDGVNVAARLESIAPPGGIAISRSVRDQIRDKLLFALEDMGEQELKGVARPVRVFQVSIEETGEVVGATASAPPPARPPATPPPAQFNRLWQGIAGAAIAIAIAAIYVVTVWQPWVTRVDAANVANMAFPLPDKPSIAVLPFDNLSGDPDQEYIADGLSEDITTALAKLSRFFVIARNSAMTYKDRAVKVQEVAEDLGVRYVLEGSIQREGDRLRVNAQLIDALSGRHIWAGTYDRDVNDLFAVKDEITLNIVSSIGAELQAGESDRIIRRETDSLQAWLLWRKATSLRETQDRENVFQSMELSRQAIEIDPNFATARAGLAEAIRIAGTIGWMDAGEAYGKAEKLLSEALEIDPDNGTAHRMLALLRQFQGQLGPAIEAARRAIEINPNDARAHATLGFVSMWPGFYDDAVREHKTAMRLSPYSPHAVRIGLGQALMLQGQDEEALAELEAVLDDDPSPFSEAWARRVMAIVLDALGRQDEARETVAKMVEVFPAWTIAFDLGATRAIRDREMIAAQHDTLRRLGLPEE